MKGIDKNVIYLGWVSFFTDMASSMVTTVLPLYVVYALHEGVDKLGIIIAVSTFVSYIFRILFGYLSDRFDMVKPFVVSGYFISALTKPLLAFAQSYITITLLRSSERMGKAIRSASKDALISSYVKNHQSGRTFGFHKMMDISGELSGAFIVFILFWVLSENIQTFKSIFLYTLLPGLLASAIALFWVKDRPKRANKPKAVINKADYALLIPLFIYFGFLLFVMSEQYIIVLAKERGFSFTLIPLLIMVYTLFQALLSYKSGSISDTIGSMQALLIAFFSGFIALFMLTINLWISMLFLALFSVMSLNAMRAFISNKAQSVAFMYGIFYAGTAICSSLGAFIMGLLWQHFGISVLIRVSEIGMLFVMALLLFYLFTKREKNAVA